jgi:hypothetical protein
MAASLPPEHVATATVRNWHSVEILPYGQVRGETLVAAFSARSVNGSCPIGQAGDPDGPVFSGRVRSVNGDRRCI